jgi:hypothetical protein
VIELDAANYYCNRQNIQSGCYLCKMLVNDDIQQRWWTLEAKLVERFGKKPDLETILFLIGIQEFGDLKKNLPKSRNRI